MFILKRPALALPIVLQFLAVALSQAQEEPSRWIRVDRKPEIVVYVDRRRIDTLDQSQFHIWMKWELPKPVAEPSGKIVDWWLTHTIVDCRGYRSVDTEIVYYLGNVFQTRIAISDTMREWVAPPPQSIGEATVIRGCLIAMGQPTDEVP